MNEPIGLVHRRKGRNFNCVLQRKQRILGCYMPSLNIVNIKVILCENVCEILLHGIPNFT